MRIIGLGIAGLVLSACGLRRMLPEGPVLAEAERETVFVGPTPSGARYASDPRLSVPILPIQVWGLTYDLDLVVVSRHPGFDMHEYARVQTPDGPIWLAKDARASSLQQSIVADLPDLEAWMPEIPVQRQRGPVAVVDRSTPDALDISLTYDNIDGERVVVSYAGSPPKTAMRKRNGSTMGHSRDDLMVVLDLSHRNFGRRATMSFDGEKERIKSIMGLVPFRMALRQTQSGLARGEVREEPFGGGLRTHHRTWSGGEVSQDWTVERRDGFVEAVQRSAMRTIRYAFLETDTRLELATATVTQHDATAATFAISFQPALPDLRAAFEGTVASRFVVDVDGQRSHAVGRVDASWRDGAAVLEVHPEEPWWVADRPMRTVISYEGDHAVVRIDIVR